MCVSFSPQVKLWSVGEVVWVVWGSVGRVGMVGRVGKVGYGRVRLGKVGCTYVGSNVCSVGTYAGLNVCMYVCMYLSIR